MEKQKGNKAVKKIMFLWLKRFFLWGILPGIIIVCTAGATFLYTVKYFKNMSAYQYQIDLPKSVDVLEPVEIGGIQQWISIRGHDRDAPILLYLHGGPGFDAIRFSHEFTGPWEEYFNVVVWDQRGAGKSYYPTETIGDTMTVEQMLHDTEDMIGYLRKRFRRDKIFLMGHSWGSILGIHMAKKHPDWIHAYIGMGQVVNSRESRQRSYDRVLKLLQEKNDTRGVRRLKAMAPYPDLSQPVGTYYENWGVMQRYLNELGIGDWHQKTDPDKYRLLMLSVLLESHTISLPEIYRGVFSSDRPSALPSLREGVRRTNIPEQLGYEFDVPVFFILGRHDWHVYYGLALEYFRKIKTPYKKVLMLEHSAHLMVVEEPGHILNFLVNEVLPLAQDPGGASSGKAESAGHNKAAGKKRGVQ